MPDRYVVAGLAHVRSAWFTELARWSTGGAIPVDLVKCLGPADLLAILASERRLSAVVVEAGLPVVDDRLLAAAGQRGTAAIVVASTASTATWLDRGADAVLHPGFDRDLLVATLAEHARPVVDGDGAPAAPRRAATRDLDGAAPAPAPLFAVSGAPGTGRSTVAIALAQGLGDDPTLRGGVLLVDLAHRAHLAILHDAGDVIPGVPEVVDAQQRGVGGPAGVRALTYTAPARGYRLLLGLRSSTEARRLDPAVAAVALTTIRRSAGVVVADVDLDPRSPGAGHPLERATHAQADALVLVARPTATGLGDLVHLLRATVPDQTSVAEDAPGLAIPRIVVLTPSARRPRRRAELTRAIAELTATIPGASAHVVGPVHLPPRSDLDGLHESVGRLPAALTRPLAAALRTALDRSPG